MDEKLLTLIILHVLFSEHNGRSKRNYVCACKEVRPICLSYHLIPKRNFFTIGSVGFCYHC